MHANAHNCKCLCVFMPARVNRNSCTCNTLQCIVNVVCTGEGVMPRKEHIQMHTQSADLGQWLSEHVDLFEELP